jgi:hypothetical protein
MDAATWDHWLYVIVPFVAYLAIVLGLVLAGEPGDKTDIVSVLCHPISSSLHRLTGWSPTHLMLVGAGGLATIALWLMLMEAKATMAKAGGIQGDRIRRSLLGRAIEVLVLGAILTGLTTVQGEFEFGVPQFQVLYLPVLGARGRRLRPGAGPGGARPLGGDQGLGGLPHPAGSPRPAGGGALNHTVPRFPLYLGAMLAVEGVGWWLGIERRLRFAVVSGALVGTVGLAGEALWVAAVDWVHISPSVLLKAVVMAPLAAGAAAVLAGHGAPGVGGRRVPAVAVGDALVMLLAALAYPLPRNVVNVEAIIRLQPVGLVNGVEQADVSVELTLPTPPSGPTPSAWSPGKGATGSWPSSTRWLRAASPRPAPCRWTGAGSRWLASSEAPR